MFNTARFTTVLPLVATLLIPSCPSDKVGETYPVEDAKVLIEHLEDDIEFFEAQMDADASKDFTKDISAKEQKIEELQELVDSEED